MQGSGFRARLQDPGLRVQGVGFGSSFFELRVEGLGFRKYRKSEAGIHVRTEYRILPHRNSKLNTRNVWTGCPYDPKSVPASILI